MAHVQLSVNSRVHYNIVFEGIIGHSASGDIAIDDFSVSSSTCPGGKTPHSKNKCLYFDTKINAFSQRIIDT